MFAANFSFKKRNGTQESRQINLFHADRKTVFKDMSELRWELLWKSTPSIRQAIETCKRTLRKRPALSVKDDQHPKTSKWLLSNAFQEGMPQSLGDATQLEEEYRFGTPG